MKFYGFLTSVGYYGRLSNGSYMLFSTEGEYEDYIADYEGGNCV